MSAPDRKSHKACHLRFHCQMGDGPVPCRPTTANWPAFLELLQDPEAAELLSASAALRNELAGALDPSDCEEVARLEELLTVQAEPRERAPRPRRARAPPLGSVTPTGWLEEVVQRSANGLPGHLFEFYPPVVDSNFVGGRSSYSSLLEDFPYALNGLVPLAAASKSPRLAQQCTDAVRRVLETGGPPGWLGPDEWPEGVMDHPEERAGLLSASLWSRWPLLQALVPWT
ncbi:unnamed protein product [Durusdinium trenchii]|uniref:Uncharacterized protein n=1 Tax=Durusdinium trenchii TaxID=1381693 RepID=A0ABP0IAY4_9DINO